MAVFMPCKAWPIKLYTTLHLSQVKCTVKPKAAGFTRIKICEEPNVGMMQVKPAAKDFKECKYQIFISKDSKNLEYPPITWKKVGGIL
jgi:hypothetical protein